MSTYGITRAQWVNPWYLLSRKLLIYTYPLTESHPIIYHLTRTQVSCPDGCLPYADHHHVVSWQSWYTCSMGAVSHVRVALSIKYMMKMGWNGFIELAGSINWWTLQSTHYIDVIMGAIASLITSLTIVYSSVYSGANQRKHQAPRHWPLWEEFTGDRWIPRTKGQ